MGQNRGGAKNLKAKATERPTQLSQMALPLAMPEVFKIFVAKYLDDLGNSSSVRK